MSDKIINGKEIANNLLRKVHQTVNKLVSEHDVKPHLAVILVGEEGPSQIYVRNKDKQAKMIGLESEVHSFKSDVSEKELLNFIEDLNANDDVNGILVQLPLPKHIDEQKIIEAIKPEKDVDGLHPYNIGYLSHNTSQALKGGNVPCTPLGCLYLLKEIGVEIQGKKAVIIGRSTLVGKPMAALLLHENATVTVAHSRTQNLEKECQQADIIVAAVGKDRFVKESWIKPGAIILDVGINRVKNRIGRYSLFGDVDYEDVINIAGRITPVPGGVGPMTIACLMRNTVMASCQQNNIEDIDII